MTWTIILDLLVIALLAAVISYATLLNKKLTAIRDSRFELQKFIESFSVSLNKAEANVKDLKRVGESALAAVLDQLAKSQTLRDELTFLVDRGETMAETLEKNIRTARIYERGVEAAPEPRQPSNDQPPYTPAPVVDPDLIQALKQVR